MNDVIWSWSGWGLVIVAASVAARAIVVAWRDRDRRVLCPGPAPTNWATWLRGALWPGWWFRRSMCGYNLSGLRTIAAEAERGGSSFEDPDAVRCPECGAVITAVRRLRPCDHWRRWRVTATMLLAAGGVAGFPLTQDDGWARVTPGMALVALEEIDDPWLAPTARSEVANRVQSDRLGVHSARRLAAKLVVDLNDDTTRWNAHRAVRLLRQLGSEAIPSLEATLEAEDAQARTMAMRILQTRPEYAPTPRLLELTLESLRSDSKGSILWPGDKAWTSSRYLHQHAREARPYLARGLHSDNYRQRFLCAFLAGYAQETSLVSEAAPILIPHLRDNRLPGDAKMAAAALFEFGPAVVPELEPFRDTDDEQQRYAIRLMLWKLGAGDAPEEHEFRRIIVNNADPTGLPFAEAVRYFHPPWGPG